MELIFKHQKQSTLLEDISDKAFVFSFDEAIQVGWEIDKLIVDPETDWDAPLYYGIESFKIIMNMASKSY